MPKKAQKQPSLKVQAEEVLKLATEHGLEQNFFFQTTFDRYMFQLEILDTLKKQIEDDGALVTKEYVKGRENVYTHPAISEYNKTVTAANQTVTTLIKIIKSWRVDSEDPEAKDKLLEALGVE